MKIIFVHQGRENLGIEYLSAVLKRDGHQVALACDSGLFGLTDNVFYIPSLEKIFSEKERVIKKIVDFSPDLVGFSVYTDSYRWCCDIARAVERKIDAKIVFGGIHPTLVPEKVIENNFVDFVVVGEGEEAFPELVESLSSGRPSQNIQNVWIKQNGRIIENAVRKPIADIDQLPYPDKAAFEEFINYRDDYIILTSRGCVFSCSYCCESYMNKLYSGRFFRRRSVNSVIAELRFMKEKYDFREVMFNDSIFFTDKVWLRELLQRYKNEIGVSFRCFGNIRYLDEEIAELLKWTGCYAIEFGLQTINEDIRMNVLNRFETQYQCKKAFKICDKFKLRYDIDHMFGLPGEKIEDFKQAAEFYSQLRYLNRIKCHNLTYFPKMRIVEIARSHNILTDREIEDIAGGRIGDFFHLDSIKDFRLKRMKENFQTLYKILPILSPGMVGYILRRQIYQKLHLLPSIIVIFLQILVAIKGKDYRFLLYFKNYPRQVMKKTVRMIKSGF